MLDIIGSIELDADGFAEGDVLVGVGEKSCVLVAAEDLDLVAVAATAEQESAVGCDVEHAGMGSRELVTHAIEQPCLTIDGKDGDAIIFQTIAGIQESAIGAQVDIRSSACPHVVRNDFLKLFQFALLVAENCHTA